MQALLRARYSEVVESQQDTERAFIGGPVILVAVIVVMLAIQMNWPSPLLFGRAKPDLLLLLVLYFAFSEGPAKAVGIGLLVGFLEDMLSAGPLGLNIFCKVLLGYTVGVVNTRLVTEHPVVMTSITFLATLCQTALLVLLSFMYRDQVPVTFMFLHIGMPMAFYNSVLAPVFFYCMDRLWTRVPARTA